MQCKDMRVQSLLHEMLKFTLFFNNFKAIIQLGGKHPDVKFPSTRTET